MLQNLFQEASTDQYTKQTMSDASLNVILLLSVILLTYCVIFHRLFVIRIISVDILCQV